MLPLWRRKANAQLFNLKLCKVMKRIIHFHAKWLFLLLVSSFFLFQACEQEDITKKEIPEIDIPSCDENTMESNFFDFTYVSERNRNLIGKRIYTDEQKTLIQEKIQDIRADNCRERFVSNVVSSLGYFAWDRAIVGEKSDGTIGIITPSIHLNADTIVSVLVAEKKEEFSYYRIVKKELLEQLQVQETDELVERLEFLKSIEKELFGEKLLIGIDKDDLYLSSTIEESQIESRSEIFQVSTCRPIALRDEERVESRSCPPGTVEFIDIVVVPCAGNDGNDSGDNSDNDGGCAFCDINYGGGSTGNGGNGDSDNDDNDGPDTDFDANGDPIDPDCLNPVACQHKEITSNYLTLLGATCGVMCRVHSANFTTEDAVQYSVGFGPCGSKFTGSASIVSPWSRGTLTSVTDGPDDPSCRLKEIKGDAYWEWQWKIIVGTIPTFTNFESLTAKDITYDCKI